MLRTQHAKRPDFYCMKYSLDTAQHIHAPASHNINSVSANFTHDFTASAVRSRCTLLGFNQGGPKNKFMFASSNAAIFTKFYQNQLWLHFFIANGVYKTNPGIQQKTQTIFEVMFDRMGSTRLYRHFWQVAYV